MIALDRILQGIRKYDVVDIFGIVYEMRKERVWMVQTEQQYICIHQVRNKRTLSADTIPPVPADRARGQGARRAAREAAAR